MEPKFERISQSMVALHPDPVGVVEFYGGQFFGGLPTTSYDYLLGMIYRARYTVIAVPFAFGFDHVAIAEELLVERDTIWAELRKRSQIYDPGRLPHFWLGHSVGCKFIALLEAHTDPQTGLFSPPGALLRHGPRRGILHEPALLMAPDIANTAQAVPIPALGRLLDDLGLGIRPDRRQTQELIERDNLFGLTAIISFKDDTIAGNAEGSPRTSDVAWFIKTLRHRHPDGLLHRELDGGHLVPVGFQIGDRVVDLDPLGLTPAEPPAALEQAVVELLGDLAARRAVGLRGALVPA